MEWNEAVQQMIDWLDAHITETPDSSGNVKADRVLSILLLQPVPCHHRCYAENYMAARRLSLAGRSPAGHRCAYPGYRPWNYGFSSQQALTRAFVYAYGCTPAAYRRNPDPFQFP